MTIIDGKQLVLGRLASNVSKRLLKGERIQIINSEKIIVVGKKEDIVEKFRKRKEDAKVKGNPHKGPKYPRMPDRMVRRSIRGMLPWKTSTGRKVFKNLMVYIGVPEELQNKEIETVEKAKKDILGNHMTIEEISKALGAKW